MSDPLDYHTPSPDAGHEAMRAPLAAAIDRLEEQAGRVDSTLHLLLATAGFARGTLLTVIAGQRSLIGAYQTLVSLVARVASLEARVTALEPPPEDPPAEEPPADPPAEEPPAEEPP